MCKTRSVGPGSFSPAPSNISLNTGMTNTRRTRDDGHRNDNDDGRVDHGAFDLSLQRLALFQEDGESPQNGIQNTAGFARVHEVYEQIIEDFGVLLAARRQRCCRPSTLVLTCVRTFLKVLFSCWLARISRHCTSGKPASIIVAN